MSARLRMFAIAFWVAACLAGPSLAGTKEAAPTKQAQPVEKVVKAAVVKSAESQPVPASPVNVTVTVNVTVNRNIDVEVSANLTPIPIIGSVQLPDFVQRLIEGFIKPTGAAPQKAPSGAR